MLNNLTKHSYIPLSSLHATMSDRSERSVRKSVSKNVNKSAFVNNSDQITRKPAEQSFCGLSASKLDVLYKDTRFHKVLDFANEQQLVFGATFALLLTCIMRPAAIIIVPSKKNKDDQKYASAHSIASGIIGFAISSMLFYPIGNAIKRVGKEHKDFIGAFGKSIKDNSYLRKEESYKTAKIFLDRAPDIITAIPKGILTVALIPPILKYVFDLKKKKTESNDNVNRVVTDYSLLNFKSTDKQNKNAFQNFMGGVK